MKEIHYRTSRSTVKPEEIEVCKHTVYLRTDIKEDPDDANFWIYKEAALTHDEFTEYSEFMKAKKAIKDEDQLTIMEAIADLYDIIANMSGGTS